MPTMEPHDPPPPYSETWTEAGSVVNGVGHSPIIGTGSDDASLTTAPSVTSARSSNGNVIYTPPETPTPEAQHQHQSTACTVTGHVRHRSNASAQAYFESRPPAIWASPSESTVARDNNIGDNHDIQIHIQVSDTTTAADLLFPDVLNTPAAGTGSSNHDITEQDWQTFVNYLIPDHTARSNAGLASRKIQDENGSEHQYDDNGLLLPSQRLNSEGGRRRIDLAEAQLDQIRSAFPDHALAERGRIARDAVWEWNDGFFVPRGVRVCLEVAETPTLTADGKAAASQRPQGADARSMMPGSWSFEPQIPSEQWADSQNSSGRQTSQSPVTAQFPSSAGLGQQPSPSSRTGPEFGSSGWNPFSQSSQALRFGPVRIEGDRVSIGNSFEADKSGVRWNGVSLEDMLAQQGLGPPPGACCPRGVGHHQGPSPWGGRGIFSRGAFGGGTFERGRGGGIPTGRGWPGHGHQHHHERQHSHHGADVTEHRRHRSHSRASHRSHQSDSSSSSISSSSSGSAPSIGSLPDLDDLRDLQLPVVKQSITAWLAHPEQPVTRDMVRAAKADIKSAKRASQAREHNAPSSSSSHPAPFNGHIDHENKFRSPPPTYSEVQATDYKALREEVRVLMIAFEGLKKNQKHQRRSDKKQRRAARKAARKARKSEKKTARAEKRAARDERKKESRAQRNERRDKGERDRHARRDEERRQAQLEREQANLERTRAAEEQRRVREEQRSRNEAIRQQLLEERRDMWSQRGHHGPRGGRGSWSPFGGFGRPGPGVPPAGGPFATWGVPHPPPPPPPGPPGPPHIPHLNVPPNIFMPPPGPSMVPLPHPHHPHNVPTGNSPGFGQHGGGAPGGSEGRPSFAISRQQWPTHHELQSTGVEPVYQHHQQDRSRHAFRDRDNGNSSSDSEEHHVGIRMADNDRDLAADISGLSIGTGAGSGGRYDTAPGGAQIADRVGVLSLNETQGALDRAGLVQAEALERAMAALLRDSKGSS